MATNKTVKPSGGDYTSLAGWEDDIEGDLTDSGIAAVVCYSLNDTTAVLIDGWLTTANDRIEISVDSSAYHGGKWDGTKYNLINNTSRPFKVVEEYVRVTGLQIKGTYDYGQHVVNVYCVTNTSDIRFKNIIAWEAAASGTSAGIAVGGGTVQIINSLAYGGLVSTSSAFYIYYGATAPIVSVLNGVGCAHVGYGVYRTSGTVVVKNCYCGGNGVADYNGTMTMTTCASSDSTGSAGLQTIAYSASTGAKFVNISAGTEDFHIQSGSSLIDVGTDLNATFTDDIDGDTRSVPWDIGVDEYVSGIFVPLTGVCG